MEYSGGELEIIMENSKCTWVGQHNLVYIIKQDDRLRQYPFINCKWPVFIYRHESVKVYEEIEA